MASSPVVAPAASAPEQAPGRISSHLVTPGETLAEFAERLSMRLALVVGMAAALLIYFLNLDTPLVPFRGSVRSINTLTGATMIVGTLIGCGIAYAWGTIEHNRRAPDSHDRLWAWGVAPVALTFSLAAIAVTILTSQAIGAAFRGLELARFQGAALGGAVAGTVVYTFAKQAARLNAERLIRTAIIVLGTGVYLTAVAIEDPNWWRVSFSYLGSWDSTAHTVFNSTLIFGGVLLLVWTTFFSKDLKTLARHQYATERGVFWLQVGLYWVAIGIMFVGIFKTRDGTFNSIMHNLSAYSLAAVLGIMMISVKWAVPRINREFLSLTWLLAAGLGITLLLAALRQINTVGLEIMSFALGILWLQSFVVTAHNAARRLEPASYPE